MWVNRPSRVSSWPCLGGAEGLLSPANHLLESTEQVHHRATPWLGGVCLSWATSHLLQMLLCSTDNTEYLTTCQIYQSGTSSKWHIVCLALKSSVWIQGVNCMKWFFMRFRQQGVKCWYFPTQRALVISAVQFKCQYLEFTKKLPCTCLAFLPGVQYCSLTDSSQTHLSLASHPSKTCQSLWSKWPKYWPQDLQILPRFFMTDNSAGNRAKNIRHALHVSKSNSHSFKLLTVHAIAFELQSVQNISIKA